MDALCTKLGTMSIHNRWVEYYFLLPKCFIDSSYLIESKYMAYHQVVSLLNPAEILIDVVSAMLGA